jgi:hypothetical protein
VSRYEVGQRVVVNEEGDVPGYYGHVVETFYDVMDLVDVRLEGRTDGQPMESYVSLDPVWPCFDNELDHVD